MRKIIFLICVLLSFVLGCSNSKNTDIKIPVKTLKSEKELPKIKWRKYTAKRLLLAKYDKKPVLLLFTRFDCKVCFEFKIKTLQNPDVVSVINRSFEPLIVRSTDDRFFKIASAFQVDRVPAIFMIQPNGKVTYFAGNVPPNIFLLYLLFTEVGI